MVLGGEEEGCGVPREGCQQSNIPFDIDVFPTALCPVDRSTSSQNLQKTFVAGRWMKIFFKFCLLLDG